MGGAGGGGSATLELAAGNGTTSGIGNGTFFGFASLVVDPSANWALTGPNTIGTVVDNGTIGVSGSLDVSSAVDPSSSGLFLLNVGSTLEIAAALGTSTQMSFNSGSTVDVDHAASFGLGVGTGSYTGPLLENFGGGTTIDLKGLLIGGRVVAIRSDHRPVAIDQWFGASRDVAIPDFQSRHWGVPKYVGREHWPFADTSLK